MGGDWDSHWPFLLQGSAELCVPCLFRALSLQLRPEHWVGQGLAQKGGSRDLIR